MSFYRSRLMKRIFGMTLILVLCLALFGCKPKGGPQGLPGGYNPPPGYEYKPPQGFDTITEKNTTIMQAFYWEMGKKVGENDYANLYPEEENLWLLLPERAGELADLGITGLWLPPASKGMAGRASVGYDVYDLWDLGEFNQKKTERTKYGTRIQLERAISALHAKGIAVYFDAVLNHRMGADAHEEVKTTQGTIGAWTKFDYPGRKGQYYNSQWDWTYFDGVDWDQNTGQNGRWLFEGKTWDKCSDDYLMGADVDYQDYKVVEELNEWGKWIVTEVDFDGFRLDAVKHVDNDFINQWIGEVQGSTGKDLFIVGEAWIGDRHQLINYIDAVGNPSLKVFDFPLYYVFEKMANQLSQGRPAFDIKELASAGLVNDPIYGNRAVMFADNHDTNRDEENKWGIHRYKYQAYAYILLRDQGVPCVWWKDFYVYGMEEGIKKLLLARAYYAYGSGYEVDNNDPDVYSYVREGIPGTGTGLVMMISDGPAGGRGITTKRINSRKPNTTFYDFTGNIRETVTTNDEGYGYFKVRINEDKGWSIWVPVF